jgi:hypothetical protein
MMGSERRIGTSGSERMKLTHKIERKKIK